jgi:hypothetical protein
VKTIEAGAKKDLAEAPVEAGRVLDTVSIAAPE